MVPIPLAIAVALAKAVAEVVVVIMFVMDVVVLLVMARPAVLVQVVSHLALSPRNLSALASSDIIVSKLMRSLLSHRDYDSIFRAATEPPDEKYLIGRLQVDHKSFDNANRLADFVSNYQLCLAKLRERIIQFDLKDSTIVYSNVDVNSSVVSGHSYDLIDDHEKLDFDMVLISGNTGIIYWHLTSTLSLATG